MNSGLCFTTVILLLLIFAGCTDDACAPSDVEASFYLHKRNASSTVEAVCSFGGNSCVCANLEYGELPDGWSVSFEGQTLESSWPPGYFNPVYIGTAPFYKGAVYTVTVTPDSGSVLVSSVSFPDVISNVRFTVSSNIPYGSDIPISWDLEQSVDLTAHIFLNGNKCGDIGSLIGGYTIPADVVTNLVSAGSNQVEVRVARMGDFPSAFKGGYIQAVHVYELVVNLQ